MTNHTDKNQPEYYHGIGTEMIPSGIFERFPELIPAVGENYWRTDGKHKKLLLVGESNYFSAEEEAVSVFRDEEKWYYSNETDKLIPKTKSMKTAVSNNTGYRPFVDVFKLANSILEENGIHSEGERLHETAFYNYFLRPAFNPGNGEAKKMEPGCIDKEVAGIALAGIINRLEPDLVIFLSKKAFVEFDYYYKKYNPGCIESDRIFIDYVAHPSCIWWNRNGGQMGKTKFRNLLTEHWL